MDISPPDGDTTAWYSRSTRRAACLLGSNARHLCQRIPLERQCLAQCQAQCSRGLGQRAVVEKTKGQKVALSAGEAIEDATDQRWRIDLFARGRLLVRLFEGAIEPTQMLGSHGFRCLPEYLFQAAPAWQAACLLQRLGTYALRQTFRVFPVTRIAVHELIDGAYLIFTDSRRLMRWSIAAFFHGFVLPSHVRISPRPLFWPSLRGRGPN